MLAEHTIATPDPALGEQVQAAIDAKTKPPGSLGRIEALAVQIALAQGVTAPVADNAHLLIFAGDHGLVEEGVSAWPSEVTAQMVLNFLGGGAAANAFARANDCAITVADAGVAGDLPDHPDLVKAGIMRGTANAARGDAMTEAQVDAALAFGAKLAADAVSNGAQIIALGDMGIGNTASATLLAHAVSGLNIANLVGPGAGLDAVGVARKRDVLEACSKRVDGLMPPKQALQAFGGLEITAIAGAMIAAASGRAVVLVDGFIATSAAIIALAARPEIRPYMVFAHQSHEPGHIFMLRVLGADPLLSLDMRLGEGTGALLALPLLRASCAMVRDMATFADAGVSGKA